MKYWIIFVIIRGLDQDRSNYFDQIAEQTLTAQSTNQNRKQIHEADAIRGKNAHEQAKLVLV